MRILDGKALGDSIRSELSERVKKRERKPKLVVMLVGENPASKVYVAMKERACAACGIISEKRSFDETIDEATILHEIDSLNADDSVDAILCQLPLPKHIDEASVLVRIDPKKDVDCFHPRNVGKLLVGAPFVKPCTPQGIIDLIKHYDIPIEGKHAVIVGRSNIVGKPLFHLLLQEHATVTVCHSRTKDLADICRSADILCAAIGRPQFILGDWVKKGAVVIDVGMNRVEDPSCEKGYRLVGDIDYEGASLNASYMTPVPRGVGPMTIAMLLSTTVQLAEYRDSSASL